MNLIKDPVDELLKADADLYRGDYVEDGGFTLRVIDALPQQSMVFSRMRFAIPLGLALLAATFVALFAGGGNFVVDAVMDIATSSMTNSAAAFVAVVGIMLCVAIGAANDN